MTLSRQRVLHLDGRRRPGGRSGRCRIAGGPRKPAAVQRRGEWRRWASATQGRRAAPEPDPATPTRPSGRRPPQVRPPPAATVVQGLHPILLQAAPKFRTRLAPSVSLPRPRTFRLRARVEWGPRPDSRPSRGPRDPLSGRGQRGARESQQFQIIGASQDLRWAKPMTPCRLVVAFLKCFVLLSVVHIYIVFGCCVNLF